MSDISNSQRATWALDTLAHFAGITGLVRSGDFTPDNIETALADLLANLRHLCREASVDFDDLASGSRGVFEEELAEEEKHTATARPVAPSPVELLHNEPKPEPFLGDGERLFYKGTMAGPWMPDDYDSPTTSRQLDTVGTYHAPSAAHPGTCRGCTADSSKHGRPVVVTANAAELLDLLKAAAARVELANAEGNPILSAWLVDARAAIANAGQLPELLATLERITDLAYRLAMESPTLHPEADAIILEARRAIASAGQ